MKIHSKMKDYQVELKEDLSSISTILGGEKDYYVIDRKVWNLYPQLFSKLPADRLYLIDALEEKKTVETALEICEAMTRLDSKRNTHLVSIGEGITQDLTGFVANILYRGIPWTFVPTTLLAAADSCIGGKTSLNHKSFKNLLGTFYPPDEILIVPAFFQTLSREDYLSGMGEIIKFQLMMGEAGLSEIEANLDSLLMRDEAALHRFVGQSLAFKKEFIEEDEFDGGKRIYLNFAHTFGHAFEVSSHYEIPHGTAVALGVVAAGKVSLERGLLDAPLLERIEGLVGRILGIRIHPGQFSLEQILSAIRKDKKQQGKELTAILFDREYQLHIVRDLQEKEVEEAVAYLLHSFHKEAEA